MTSTRSRLSRAAGRVQLAASTRRQCAERCLATAMPALSPAGKLATWRTEAFASGAYATEFAALARLDQASAIEKAGIGQLRQAREVAAGLADFGALLVMHGLLMPDTPGLAALRARISEFGAGPMLINLARQVMKPPGVASAVASCLDPMYSALYRSLSELVASGPPLLHLAADAEHDPEHFMETWLSSLRELSGRPAAGFDASARENPEA